MQQMFTASQLRQYHEDRIAPYLEGNEVAKPKKIEEKTGVKTFTLFKQFRKAIQS